MKTCAAICFILSSLIFSSSLAYNYCPDTVTICYKSCPTLSAFCNGNVGQVSVKRTMKRGLFCHYDESREAVENRCNLTFPNECQGHCQVKRRGLI